MSDYNRYTGDQEKMVEESPFNNSESSDEKKSCFKIRPYFNQEAIAAVRIYQYYGGDSSFSARYFYGPLS